jgi:hypothetical protein
MIPRRELTFVVSDGGVGKSWLLLVLSETLRGGGTSFLGNYAAPCDVVYLDMELSAAHYARRARKVRNGLIEQGIVRAGANPHETYYLESPNITLAGAQAFLDRPAIVAGDVVEVTAFDYLHALIKTTGAGLLIIDPLANLWGDVDENAAGETSAVCRALLEVARATGAAIVIAHHTNKGKVVERGSTAIRNNAASMFNVVWAGEQYPKLRKMTHGKSRHAAEIEEMMLQFTWQADAFTVEPLRGAELDAMKREASEAQAAQAVRTVLDIVTARPAWHYNKGALTDALQNAGLSKGAAVDAIERAVDAGVIREEEKGGRGNPLKYAGNDHE